MRSTSSTSAGDFERWRAALRDAMIAASSMSQTPATIARASAADAADVALARDGDGEAFARIVRRHQAAVGARMRRFARDRGTVEQLTHDAFVEAYVSLGKFRGDAPLIHWLQRIATRVGYRHWTRRSREPDALGETPIAAPATVDSAERDDERERLRRAVDALPPRDRLAITLVYLEEREIADAAVMAGWSRTMMKVQLFRARAKLRALLEPKGATTR